MDIMHFPSFITLHFPEKKTAVCRIIIYFTRFIETKINFRLLEILRVQMTSILIKNENHHF